MFFYTRPITADYLVTDGVCRQTVAICATRESRTPHGPAEQSETGQSCVIVLMERLYGQDMSQTPRQMVGPASSSPHQIQVSGQIKLFLILTNLSKTKRRQKRLTLSSPVSLLSQFQRK